jgi:hypothetical protein
MGGNLAVGRVSPANSHSTNCSIFITHPIIRHYIVSLLTASLNKQLKRPQANIKLKSTIFWDITPCSPLSVNWRFGGTYRLHLQDRKNKLGKKLVWKQVASRSLFFLLWRWRRYVPPKRRLTLNGLHCVISQKMVLFITTAVTTSNPTYIKLAGSLIEFRYFIKSKA